MIREEAYILTKEFIEKSGMKEGELMVVGCSTSEVIGSSIGKDSNPDVAKEIFEGIYEAACESRIYIAAQCCELVSVNITKRTANLQRWNFLIRLVNGIMKSFYHLLYIAILIRLCNSHEFIATHTGFYNRIWESFLQHIRKML